MDFDSHIDTVDRILQSKEATIRVLKANLSKAQARMKTIADGKGMTGTTPLGIECI